MSLKISQQEIDSLLKQPYEVRYRYFIKRVCDTGKIWGLYNEGWALAGDSENTYLPLWPTQEFAEICAKDNWKGFHSEPIEIHEFIDQHVNELKENNIVPTIFYLPTDKGVYVDPQDLIKDLKSELSRIE